MHCCSRGVETSQHAISEPKAVAQQKYVAPVRFNVCADARRRAHRCLVRGQCCLVHFASTLSGEAMSRSCVGGRQSNFRVSHRRESCAHNLQTIQRELSLGQRKAVQLPDSELQWDIPAAGQTDHWTALRISVPCPAEHNRAKSSSDFRKPYARPLNLADARLRKVRMVQPRQSQRRSHAFKLLTPKKDKTFPGPHYHPICDMTTNLNKFPQLTGLWFGRNRREAAKRRMQIFKYSAVHSRTIKGGQPAPLGRWPVTLNY